MKQYQFMNTTEQPMPIFLPKITDAIAESWESLGSIACKLTEINNKKFEIMFFPAIREVYGGGSDGEKVFPGFNFDIAKFVRVFDKPPKVSYDCLQKNMIEHLLFSGWVNGYNVKIAILSAPPNGQRATERVYANGPKQGTIEPIIAK